MTRLASMVGTAAWYAVSAPFYRRCPDYKGRLPLIELALANRQIRRPMLRKLRCIDDPVDPYRFSSASAACLWCHSHWQVERSGLNDARMVVGFALGVLLMVASLFLIWSALVAATGNENVFSILGTDGRSHPTLLFFLVLSYFLPEGFLNRLRFAALQKVSD